MMFDSFETYDVQETRRISKAEGKIEGKKESIFELLEEFGAIPETLRQKIIIEKDMNTLKSWVKLAAKSSSIKEFISKMN